MLPRSRNLMAGLLVKNAFWGGLTVVVKAVFQLSILKITALSLGAPAIGILGQAASLLVILQSISNGGIVNFLVISLSARNPFGAEIKRPLGNVFAWVLISHIILALPFLLFSDYFSELTFSTDSYSGFFVAIAAVGWLLAINPLILGILSAEQDVSKILIINVLGLGVGIGVFYFSVEIFGVFGVVVGVLSMQLSQALIGLMLMRYWGLISLVLLTPSFEWAGLRRLLNFSFVAMVTGTLSALVQILLRTQLVRSGDFTWAGIGEWQSIIKISEISASFLGISFITTYFPELSKTQSKSEFKKLVLNMGAKYFGIIFLACLFIMSFAPFILKGIYSEDFVHLAPYLRVHIFGDIFRFATWIISYALLAGCSLRYFLLLEIVGISLTYGFFLLLGQSKGIMGLAVANVCVGTITLIVSILLYFYVFRRGYIEKSG